MRFLKHTKWRAALLVTLLAMSLGVWSGCGQQSLTGSEQPVYTADNPPPVLHGPGVLGSAEWLRMAQGWVGSKGGVVEGGRYTLTFPEGALSSGIFVTVDENSPNFMEIELGPHGTEFAKAVTLSCNYAGTNADPDAPNYDGCTPVFFWYNPVSDQWLEIPGVKDTTLKTYTVSLTHFSTYALGGKIVPPPGTGDW